MYLGDVVRRVIVRMSQESDIFDPISSKLSMPFILRYALSVCVCVSLSDALAGHAHHAIC